MIHGIFVPDVHWTYGALLWDLMIVNLEVHFFPIYSHMLSVVDTICQLILWLYSYGLSIVQKNKYVYHGSNA